MIDLKGRVAIVTGASRGIGRAIADDLAKNGANVVVVATKQDACDKVAAEIAKTYSVSAIGVATDVSSFDACQAMADVVLKEFGKIDILVNNAGIIKDNLLLRMSAQDWHDVMNVNLGSVFNCTKAILRPMLKNKYGRIINISSVVGVMGNPGQANYAASKAGMLGFTKSTARELGAKQITCNAVAPGFIDTDMIDALPKEYLDNIIGQVPLKRLGSTDDISSLVSFLASDASSYITGQVISVDGGMHM